MMLDYDYRNILEEFDPYLDDCEMVELGKSKELVSDELYMPCHKSRDWIRCYISTTQPDCFRLYLESKKRRFLLSAKRFSQDCFLISTYEDFPVIESPPKRGFIAKLVQNKDSSFLVSLNNCHLCDENLGYFSCGRCDEREVVAKIVHSVKKYHAINMEFRCIGVTIPTVTDNGMRKIWCPRSFRKVNTDLPSSADVNEALYLCPQMGTKFVNKLPEWNEEAGSLILKFQGNRVLTASAKNFLLYDERYSKLDLAEQTSRKYEKIYDSSNNNSSNNNGHNGTSNYGYYSSNSPGIDEESYPTVTTPGSNSSSGYSYPLLSMGRMIINRYLSGNNSNRETPKHSNNNSNNNSAYGSFPGYNNNSNNNHAVGNNHNVNAPPPPLPQHIRTSSGDIGSFNYNGNNNNSNTNQMMATTTIPPPMPAYVNSPKPVGNVGKTLKSKSVENNNSSNNLNFTNKGIIPPPININVIHSNSNGGSNNDNSNSNNNNMNAKSSPPKVPPLFKKTTSSEYLYNIDYIDKKTGSSPRMKSPKKFIRDSNNNSIDNNGNNDNNNTSTPPQKSYETKNNSDNTTTNNSGGNNSNSNNNTRQLSNDLSEFGKVNGIDISNYNTATSGKSSAATTNTNTTLNIDTTDIIEDETTQRILSSIKKSNSNINEKCLFSVENTPRLTPRISLDGQLLSHRSSQHSLSPPGSGPNSARIASTLQQDHHHSSSSSMRNGEENSSNRHRSSRHSKEYIQQQQPYPQQAQQQARTQRYPSSDEQQQQQQQSQQQHYSGGGGGNNTSRSNYSYDSNNSGGGGGNSSNYYNNNHHYYEDNSNNNNDRSTYVSNTGSHYLDPNNQMYHEMSEDEVIRRMKALKKQQQQQQQQQYQKDPNRKKKTKRVPKDASDLAILQFGKSSETRFILDFKYPLSPLQAFAIALSTFAADETMNNRHIRGRDKDIGSHNTSPK